MYSLVFGISIGFEALKHLQALSSYNSDIQAHLLNSEGSQLCKEGDRKQESSFSTSKRMLTGYIIIWERCSVIKTVLALVCTYTNDSIFCCANLRYGSTLHHEPNAEVSDRPPKVASKAQTQT